MSLTQLRTFLEVAERGSVREAAERLVVSQPAVSSALASLQREVGAALVERSGRGIAVTAAGREVVRDGRRLFAMIEGMKRGARAAAMPATGALRLAVVTTAAEQLLPPLLTGFRADHRPIDFGVEVANRARVWDRLQHWEVDLAIAGRTPADRGFRTLATRPNELIVVASQVRESETGSLGAATWLLREPGSGTRGATEEFFAALDISPPRLTIGSNGAIRECVRAGLGVSLLSREAVARDLALGALFEIPTAATPIARPWHLVGNGERRPTRIAQRFVDFAVDGAGFIRSP